MSRLLLLRHAKSSWDSAALSDFDRPLSPRGQRASKAIAAVIAERDLVPDRILCSPARRTRETLAALDEKLDGSTEVEFVEELYDAPYAGYLPIIASRGGDAASLMVIGHNPTIQATARAFAESGEPGLVAEVSTGYPTGALAVIDLDTDDWSTAAPLSGYLSAFIRPRDLEAGRKKR